MTNACLFVYYCFTYFFPRTSKIWSLTHYTFVCNDSNCKIVSCYTMVLFEHYFWRHVTRSSTIFCVVFRMPFSCNTKISQPQISVSIKDKIFWLYISMNNACIMNCFQCLNKACNKKLSCLLWKLTDQ